MISTRPALAIVLRVLGQEIKDAHSVDGVKARPARLDGFEDLPERPDAAQCLQEGCPRPHPGGLVRAQAVAQHRQAEAPGRPFVEHVKRREQAKDPVERRLVGARGLRQLLRAHRALGEQVGDPQLGRRINRARDVSSPDQSQQRRGGRAIRFGCLRAACLRAACLRAA
jgi:hypothetical protein